VAVIAVISVGKTAQTTQGYLTALLTFRSMLKTPTFWTVVRFGISFDEIGAQGVTVSSTQIFETYYTASRRIAAS
jgi:hypothetical protein